MLERFFHEAYSDVKEGHRRLFLVTSKSLPSKLQPSTSSVEAFDSPFLGEMADRQYIEIISSHKQFTGRVFVVLDDSTLKSSPTCRLVDYEDAYAVRSDFHSVQAALNAILDGSTNMQRLRNEAAMSGGHVLRKYSANSATPVQHDGNFLKFENRPPNPPSWEKCCKKRVGAQSPICIPVFCTIEVPLEVILTTFALFTQKSK